MLKATVLLLILPCCAARGVFDRKKAEQLVNSVYSQENQTRLDELKKPRLSGADDAMFLKQYHKDDAEEVDEAGMTAETYSEVPFDAVLKMLKTAEEVPKVEKAKDAKSAADSSKHHHLKQHHLKHEEGMKPASHPEPVKAPKTFIDLGSGLGRTVLFASALGAFESCEGVELSDTRHQMAVDALAKFKHLAPAAAKHVTLHQGNFLDNDAYFKKDAMLLDNSFLSDGVLQQIVRKFRNVSERGSIMILTKKLNQLSDRAATLEHVAVEGKNGQRQTLFKYTRT